MFIFTAGAGILFGFAVMMTMMIDYVPQGLVLFLVFAVMMIMMIDYGGGVMVP